MCNVINLDDEDVLSYVNCLIANPKESRFGIAVVPPLYLTDITKSKFLLPKVFLWSPCEHFELKIECPLHKGVLLKPWQWAKHVRRKRERVQG